MVCAMAEVAGRKRVRSGVQLGRLWIKPRLVVLNERLAKYIVNSRLWRWSNPLTPVESAMKGTG